MNFDTVVIGSGPAGFAAAVSAAEQGEKVLICEQLSRLGAKILVSGGGRCNLTNNADLDSFVNSFSSSRKFIKSILSRFYRTELISFLAETGVEVQVAEDGFHIFPKAGRASAVVNALRDYSLKLGVKISTDTEVTELVIEDNRIRGVKTSKGEFSANRVILCTGGKSYRKCGGTGSGYLLAKQAGHKITKLLPAMVAVKFNCDWVEHCAGLTVQDARFYINHPRYSSRLKRGSIMFTHSGLTGLRLLDLSGDIADLLQQNKSVMLNVDFTPDISREMWLKLFKEWKKNKPKNRVHKLISAFMPQRLANTLSEQAGKLIGVKADKITDEQRDKLIDLITGYDFEISGTEDFDRAMVTRGGIKLKDISPETLESRIVAGLHFAGEVLNVDGPCGGYNIQWAFSSGWIAGISGSVRQIRP